MNDFTKEDLIILKKLTLQHVNLYRQNSDCIELMGKLQSMIDNYCEPNANKPNFTQDQKSFICYQIGVWYCMMKPLLEDQHNLGYMKEKLKLMVCDDE